MKHLSYDDGTYRAEIDIRPATTDDGIQRGTLTYDIPKDDKLPFRVHSLFATLFCASTIQELTCEVKSDAVGKEPQYADIPFTLEAMRKLPDGLTVLWEMKVLDVNPQWRYGLNADQLEAIQKKATPLSGGSTTSTEQPAKASKKT
jgi:hypothetical protein